MAELGNVLIVIPARGGSKRLPRKNVLPLAGKPLVCWTIEAALSTGLDARILVTSDDEEVLDIARMYEPLGVFVHKRPDDLATDTAGTTDVLIDAVESERKKSNKPDTVILLQPTSPLRSSEDIRVAIDVYKKSGCGDTVVTVCEVEHPTAWVGTITEDSYFEGVDLSGRRSQDFRKEYRLNGAVYISNVASLLKHRSLFTERVKAAPMPRSRSFDIDTQDDFSLCEAAIISDSG